MKLTGSEEEEVSSVLSWGDCALTCQARPLCTGWTWQSSSATCRTVTGQLQSADQQGFISGARDCQPAANITGWLTCKQNNPYDSANNDARYEVMPVGSVVIVMVVVVMMVVMVMYS